MKIIALIAAGALGLTGLAAAAPAEAQRYGWHDGFRDGPRFHRGFRGHRGGFYAPRRFYAPPRAFYGGRGFARPRVVCRIQRGWYGPERVCIRRFR
jgi:hypothetical protein